MKWTLKLGRIGGIDVRMHLTFLLLIGWVALVHWRQGQSLAAAVIGVLFILAVFMCVLLHEFGHAFDMASGEIKGRFLSSESDFAQAYRRDLEGIRSDGKERLDLHAKGNLKNGTFRT